MLKIYREIPSASKEERAYWDGATLIIEYHKWLKENYDYIDATQYIDYFDIHHVAMEYGKRNGFKRTTIHFNETTFSLSKNHRSLCITVYKLCKERDIPIIKVIE